MDHRVIPIFICISLFFLIPMSAQALTCTSQTSSCSGSTEIFRLSADNNAHAADPGYSGYSRRICCSEPGITISTSCSGTHDTALRISATSNAHAEKNSQSTSGYHDICIGSSSPGITDADCVYTGGSCPADYECVARISSNTNAHVSSCTASNSYDRICCKVEADTQGPTTTISPDGRSWTNSDVGFTLTCSDPSGCQTSYHKTVDDGTSCVAGGFSSGTSGTVTCSSGSVCRRDVCYYSTDMLGNTESTRTSNTFNIDKQSPSTTESLSGTLSNGWYSTNVGVTLTCSDGSGSGCSQTRYCTSSQTCSPNTIGTSTTLASQGTNHLNFLSTDNAGNTESYSAPRVTVQIDTIDPSTTLTPSGTLGPGGWYSTDVGITLTCSDSGSGCDQVQYCTDASDSCTPGTAYSGQFQINSEGTNYVRYRSTDVAGNVEPTQSDQIRIDKNPPTASIDPLPAWTNATDSFNIDFEVTWRGYDAGSGINSFDIQYRTVDLLTGSQELPWTAWGIGETSNPGTSTFLAGTTGDPTRNNKSYEFRVQATDNAGLVYDFTDNPLPYNSTNIDISPPNCGISPLGTKNTLQFDVDASCIEGESGMDTMEFRFRFNGGSWVDPLDQLNLLCTAPSLDNVDSVTLDCTLLEGTWDMQVSGRDISGNTGSWSSSTTVDIDATPPDLTVSKPASEWTNIEPPDVGIDIEWESTDSELFGYELYYYFTSFQGSQPGDGNWTHWMDRITGPGSGVQTAIFQDNDPLGLTLFPDNTYYINITAVDDAGNKFHEVVNVTVDQTPPQLTIDLRDENGDTIPPGLIKGVDLVNITTIAYDDVSGISSNKLEYNVFGGTSPGFKSLDCGPGPSQGYSKCSTANGSATDEILFDDTVSIQYSAIAFDKAGNYFRTPTYFSVSHPLANFGTKSAFLELGTTRLVAVAVRNIQGDADDVELNLTGSDTFSKFEFNCEPNRCLMAPNRRSMTVLNLNPFDERVYYVRLISSQPDEYYLELHAKSGLDPSITDYHVLNITSSYPVYFPGMEPWAMILLLLLAGLSFGLVSNRIDI